MPSPTSAQIGAAIRQVRENRGLTIEGFAAEIGIDRAGLGRIERGIGNPTWNMIARLADELEIDAVELVRLAGTMPASS